MEQNHQQEEQTQQEQQQQQQEQQEQPKTRGSCSCPTTACRADWWAIQRRCSEGASTYLEGSWMTKQQPTCGQQVRCASDGVGSTERAAETDRSYITSLAGFPAFHPFTQSNLTQPKPTTTRRRRTQCTHVLQHPARLRRVARGARGGGGAGAAARCVGLCGAERADPHPQVRLLLLGVFLGVRGLGVGGQEVAMLGGTLYSTQLPCKLQPLVASASRASYPQHHNHPLEPPRNPKPGCCTALRLTERRASCTYTEASLLRCARGSAAQRM